MSRRRIRFQVAALAFILLPAATGILAVHASATCERFVRTYVTKPMRNRVSKQTAEAWTKWGVGHPNWKPKPNLHRPKYIMTREEALQKVEFACSVDTIPTTTDMAFIPAVVDGPPSIVDLPPMSTKISFPDEVPPEVAEITPNDTWPSLGPFVPPILSGIPPGGVPIVPTVPPGGATPEPASLLLVASGIGGIWLLRGMKTRRAAVARA